MLAVFPSHYINVLIATYVLIPLSLPSNAIIYVLLCEFNV